MPNYDRRRVASLLELEAAEFFKLDLSHMDFSANKSALDLRRHISTPSSTSASSSGSPSKRTTAHFEPIKMQARRSGGGAGDASSSSLSRSTFARSSERLQRQRAPCANAHHRRRSPARPVPKTQPKMVDSSLKPQVDHRRPQHNPEPATAAGCERDSLRPGRRVQQPKSHAYELATACSSASSTNSLPSISSSPSVSPSLVCPHLSLDDILAFRQGPSGSPHTVGLCPRCRLDPPPNVHSPLSPHFRPHYQAQAPAREMGAPRTREPDRQPPRMSRGHSDHQASCQEARKRRLESAGGPPPPSAPVRQRSDLSRVRDDSLDFGLAPAELRRMQLSPSLRNSVEFIRRNSIESGRVVRVHKNGQPFEKPLRVCILRDEFSSLNHLLDHIGSRLLVPNGARFLFHLDGQLVYSVHELKHNSVYVVSGSRHYDYRTSEVLRERQLKEQQAQANRAQHHRTTARDEDDKGGGGGGSAGAVVPASSQTQRAQTQRATAAAAGGGDSSRRATVGPASGAERAPVRYAGEPQAGVSRQTMAKVGANSRASVVGGARQLGGSDAKSQVSGRNKFSRYDDSTGLSAGGLNASTQSIVGASDDPLPARPTRAKSELSALPQQRKAKKNVTFMDTGRGSSPAISDLGRGHETESTSDEVSSSKGGLWRPTDEREVPPSSATKQQQQQQQQRETPSAKRRDFSTSEIGIQVSDSIEGFLIDLPVALPAKGDDSNLKRSRNAPRAANARASGAKGAPPTSRRPKQIVTITERQLSLEEMNELKDLSAGDHHHEVTIKWDTPHEGGGPGSERTDSAAGESEPEPEVVPDRANTIAIGTDPEPPPQQSDRSSERLITSAGESEADAQWQYPGGRAASATPTERPVSQSGPSEMVRARVTTPTPSLSTAGDNNSLAMSYETVSQNGDRQSAVGVTTTPISRPERLRATPSELPAKERVEVTGTLCAGLDEPARNFRLVWVNGFAINDLYPENTYSGAVQEWAAGGGTKSGSSSPSARQLTPGYTGAGAGGQMQGKHAREGGAARQFKPSERYHNWICHSRKHDELIYPAGSLIVLWCRWSNEQRYYARHTSNVTALALATLDLDLAASAQVCDLNERPPIASNVHLWSLASLDTLLIVQDDQFRLKLIFSLRLRNANSTGCELSIAARDEKQLLLFELNRKRLPADGQGRGEGAESAGVMMKATKPLQSNQLPLFLLRVPNLSEGKRASQREQAPASGEPTISFGRRHFSIWSSEPKQRKLRPMQSESKSAKLVELVGRANCLCRLSPGEFLAGDSEGNVALLLLNCRVSPSGAADRAPEFATSPRTKRPAARTPITGPDASSKYALEVLNILGPSRANTGGVPNPAITCLARVTGSLFMSADSTCTIRFWKIKRAQVRDESRKQSVPSVRLASSSLAAAGRQEQAVSCEQLSSISLPPDLGFICTLIMAQYKLRESLVEFYVVSTSNTILFGSVKLPSQYSKPNRGAAQSEQQQRPPAPIDLLANSSLSVVYEGHETSASSLVADYQQLAGSPLVAADTSDLLGACQYFTCSLDCRICKWQGRRLVWKSLLPSACASLAVHPTGFVLAVGSLDGTVYILDKVSGLLVSYFPLTPVRINCLAYSSDGSLLAAACANGSIFMLPVYERGLKYKKVSIFQSPHPVVSLQFSMDNRYMLTSVTHGPYQELILWDLPNFRYMRDNVKLAADKIRWFDSICSGSEDVRAIWENANLSAGGQPAPLDSQLEGDLKRSGHKRPGPGPAVGPARRGVDPATKTRDTFVVNLSCHRLIKSGERGQPEAGAMGDFVVASDTRGYLRLFRYPCYDIQQGFYAIRISSSAVNCCRFLHSNSSSSDHFVSTSLDGSICLWAIE